MLNVVLDSNILVSAFLTPKGESAEILQRAKEHDLYLSHFILHEVQHTLYYPRIQRKYKYSPAAIERHVKDLFLASTIVVPQSDITACNDPKDNAVLACAVEAQADYLVTRNIKHFPERYQGVEIIHPSEFLKLLRGTKG